MRIDAHQHFWAPARGDYGWLTKAAHPGICRDFGPEDLRPHLDAAGIDRTVLVQAAATEAETQFLLATARRCGFVAGVVGWTDLAAAEAPEKVAALAGNGMLVGLRPMLQDLADDAWIARPAVSDGLAAMEAAELVFDGLVTPRHLPYLLEVLTARPGLRVVIDHGAKPAIAAGDLTSWAQWMRRLARETSSSCKLSGLASEAAAGWTAGDLRPYVDVLLEAFGPDRLMWGSDWPVVEEAGGYVAWLAAAEALTGGLSDVERARLFGGTAEQIYGLKP